MESSLPSSEKMTFSLFWAGLKRALPDLSLKPPSAILSSRISELEESPPPGVKLLMRSSAKSWLRFEGRKPNRLPWSLNFSYSIFSREDFGIFFLGRFSAYSKGLFSLFSEDSDEGLRLCSLILIAESSDASALSKSESPSLAGSADWAGYSTASNEGFSGLLLFVFFTATVLDGPLTHSTGELSRRLLKSAGDLAPFLLAVLRLWLGGYRGISGSFFSSTVA